MAHRLRYQHNPDHICQDSLKDLFLRVYVYIDDWFSLSEQ